MENIVVRAEERILVWDLPTRLFHWLFAGGFVTAFAISQLAEEEGPLFPYHAIVGLALALMVVLRLAWGIVGTRYARLGALPVSPGAVLAYARDTLVGGGRRYVGHNPGSSVAIVAMLLGRRGLGATGFLMSQGNEGVKEAHEILAYAMAAAAGLHIAGVILHTLRHRENITASMVTGRKTGLASEGIGGARPLVALVFLGIVGAWSVGMVKGYDAVKRTMTLPLLGTSMRLGEDEGGEKRGGHSDREREDEEDDD